MNIGAIVQARTTSTRLPGKVLRELPFVSGITVLEQVLTRLGKSKHIKQIIVATTTNTTDDGIVKVSSRSGVGCFRGSESDVLSRYYHAAREAGLDVVVRITSDCPCIDPDVVDEIVERHISGKADYTSNTLRRTYPHGLDAEAFSFTALERAFNEAHEEPEREHVTPYIYRSGNFEVLDIEAPEGLRRPDIRITLDTREDYTLLCAVYDYLYSGNPFFTAQDIVRLFEDKPWLMDINGSVIQKKVFESLADELGEAARVLDLQDMKRSGDIIRESIKRLG